MFTRSSGPLLVAYILITVAGVFFLNSPPLSLVEETEYGSLVVAWGLFYLLGGLFSLVSVSLRGKFKNNISLWYFEIAGLALSITANLVYGYALMRTGIIYQEFNVVAVSLIISAFAASLISRSIEALRFTQILKTAARSTIPTARG